MSFCILFLLCDYILEINNKYSETIIFINAEVSWKDWC